MFFVVFSVHFKRYFVVPKNWIQDMSFEEQVNYSINRNQEYRVYYPDNVDALQIRIPDGNFAPNFTAEMSDTFTGDGCRVCTLAKYFSKYIK